MPDDPVAREIAVVIPVHDEEELLARCLESVALATRQLHRTHAVTSRVVVVLDACTDRSEEIADSFGVELLRASVRNVGAARAAGIEQVATSTTTPDDRLWIACTDADCVVPPEWLSTLCRRAEGGAELVLGRAWLDPADVADRLYRRWVRHYRGGDVLRHIHGANLGVALDAYRRAGGFALLREHEDVDLVARLLAAGVSVAAGSDVITSGRPDGRTPGGFAGYLRALGEGGGSERGGVDAADRLGPEAVVHAPEHRLRPGGHPDARV